jgi:trans-2,3-dihydro-3-hydroxyanthranilate isomerase
MRLDYHTLDVFTRRVFGGNPLAVFPEAGDLSAETMQRIARELNLSETVFVVPPHPAPDRFRIRIFTPGAEVPFAGHPTVGTAFFLVASGRVPVPAGAREVRLTLEEEVGPVPVTVQIEGGRPVGATLATPRAYEEHPVEVAPDDLAAMLSLAPGEIGAPGLHGLAGTGPLEPAFASAGLPFLIVPVREVAAANRVRIDSAVWAAALPEGAFSRWPCVVAPGGSGGADLHVRVFCPDIGVPEDPATGSANAALCGYLARRANADDGTLRWRVEQGIEMGRPSALTVEADLHDGRIEAIRVGGGAVSVSRCTMELNP